jgi:AraC family transcriptional activator of pobA
MQLKLEQEIRESFCISHFEQTEAVGNVPERLAYHRIILIEEGRGELVIDEQHYEVKGKSLFLIAKGQVCGYTDGAALHAFVISFGDCFWERSPSSASNCKAVLFNNATDNQLLPLSAADFMTLQDLFINLHKEFLQPAYVNKLDVMAAYLKIIMIKLANINVATLPEYDAHARQVYRKFIELVSMHYKSLHDVEAYAQQMHLTARRLSDLCRKCSGKGAKEVISGQLLAEAKRSLQFSALPVKEIAYELNFSTPEQFSNFFKKNSSLSPQDYRNSFVNIGR